MKKVVYIGTMFLPDKNALCQRAFSVLKSAEDLHYEPVAIGFSDSAADHEILEDEYEGVKCYTVKYPCGASEWFRELYEIAPFVKILKQIGLENIQAVILADYRFPASLRLKHFCRKNQIHFVADIMDWFEWNGITLRSLVRMIDMWLRMFALYPFVSRKICISSRFYKMYHRTK